MIPGLIYIADFISLSEEMELLNNIDSNPWKDDLKRRVQHYGYVYDYTKKIVDISMRLGEFPDWLHSLQNRVSTYFNTQPDQAIINEYQPGKGIGKHVDCVPCFGPIVTSLSLESPVMMEFETKSKKENLWLEPRSLVVLSKESRYDWTHSILPQKEDLKDGILIPRTRRVSITFRTVNVKK